MNKKYVYLGRFSPFHKGHQKIVDLAINNWGVENVLIMIGSSNSYNKRTPYTYEERKAMMLSVYPDLEIIPLPDIVPGLVYFDGSTNGQWLTRLKEIEAERGAEFTFVGGAPEDLDVLALGFPTKVVFDRKTVGRGISATKVRETLNKNDQESLEVMLGLKVLPLAVSGYAKFRKTL